MKNIFTIKFNLTVNETRMTYSKRTYTWILLLFIRLSAFPHFAGGLSCDRLVKQCHTKATPCRWFTIYLLTHTIMLKEINFHFVQKFFFFKYFFRLRNIFSIYWVEHILGLVYSAVSHLKSTSLKTFILHSGRDDARGQICCCVDWINMLYYVVHIILNIFQWFLILFKTNIVFI